MVLTTMAKPGRNDPCPCGSGKKYKRCCLPKAGPDKGVLLEQPSPSERAVVSLAERVARTWHHNEDDEVDDASHAVVELVHAGKLEDAEAAARDLLKRYPHEPDGWDCLGIVHEARGENRRAADCYRKMLEIMRQHPDDYNPGYETEFAELINKLDPPAPN